MRHNTQQILNNIDGQRDLLNGRRFQPNTEPLTQVDIANLRYPDAGVLALLREAYVAYIQGAARQPNTNGGRRRVAQLRAECKEAQIRILNDYWQACDIWRGRNDTQRGAYGRRLRGPALDARIQQYRVDEAGQGPQQPGIRVGHLNLDSLLTLNHEVNPQGIPDKFDNLQVVLAAYNFDVFVVGESKIKGVDDAHLIIPGYAMVRLDRDYPSHAENHGGLAVYIRDGIDFLIQNIENRPVRDVFGVNFVSLLQLIDIQLIFGNQPPLRIVAVYNPPWGGHEASMIRVNEHNAINGGLLHDYRNEDQDIVILGDINLDIGGNANQVYQNRFQQLGFIQSIAEPTRLDDNDTLLDHIYSKRPNGVPGNFVLESGVIPGGVDNDLAGFADHKMIYCTIQRN